MEAYLDLLDRMYAPLDWWRELSGPAALLTFLPVVAIQVPWGFGTLLKVLL